MPVIRILVSFVWDEETGNPTDSSNRFIKLLPDSNDKIDERATRKQICYSDTCWLLCRPGSIAGTALCLSRLRPLCKAESETSSLSAQNFGLQSTELYSESPGRQGVAQV